MEEGLYKIKIRMDPRWRQACIILKSMETRWRRGAIEDGDRCKKDGRKMVCVSLEDRIKKEGWVCFDNVRRYVVRAEFIIKFGEVVLPTPMRQGKGMSPVFAYVKIGMAKHKFIFRSSNAP